MPTRDTAPTGAPNWIDLLTTDVARSRAFYTQLFGWGAEEPAAEYGGYFSFTKDDAPIAGCMPRMSEHPSAEEMPDAWSVYLASDDAQKTVEAAQANGGSAYLEPMPVGDLGTMAMVGDVDGAAIGVWQPGKHIGFREYMEPNTPGWFELHTRAYEKAVPFYRNVFGWETKVESDTPEFRYTTLTIDDLMYAGIMDATGHLPEGVPSHWGVYFAVADTDATLTRATELGAAELMGPDDTPYGRIAVLSDPTGAQFRLVGPNEAMPAR
jgi:predicted enzyme related to lactoylglutathione lyase